MTTREIIMPVDGSKAETKNSLEGGASHAPGSCATIMPNQATRGKNAASSKENRRLET